MDELHDVTMAALQHALAGQPETPQKDKADVESQGSNGTLPSQDPEHAPAVLTSSSGGVQGGNRNSCFKIVMLYRTVRPGSPAQALLPCSISLQQAHTTWSNCFNARGLARQDAAVHVHAAAACSCTLTRGAHQRPKHLLPAGDSQSE